MKPQSLRKLLIFVIVLLFFGIVGFFIYRNYQMVSLYVNSFNISQTERDEKEISDLVKYKLADYFSIARGLFNSDIREKLSFSQEKTKIYRPFKTFWIDLDKLSIAKSDLAIISLLRFGVEWYVPVSWDDEGHNTIILVKKENGRWEESGMIGSPISDRIKFALEKVGLNLELSDGNLRKNVFYYTFIRHNNSGYTSQVIFVTNKQKLFGIPVGTLREERMLGVFPATSISKILPR